jgi:predicted amidohydrolase YtcJ
VTSSPDLLLSGGPVWTGDVALPWASAVAVTDGRVTAVGGDDVRELAGRRTEQIDLSGRFLLPGFQDAHVHPVAAGLAMRACDLSDLSDPGSHLAAIGDYAASHPELPWVLGGGWSFPDFPGGLPRREQLDAVVPDRPVYLQVSDGHSAWVNSRALELAGIDARTADPAGGRIERGADGHPTGVLHEQAMALVGDLAPDPTAAAKLAALELAQSRLHSLGITAWQDAIVGRYGGWQDQYDTYIDAGTSGLLTARVRGALWWDRTRGLEQVEDLVARREQGTAGRFTAGTVKIMQDGIPENFTAAMSSPYLDACGCSTANDGLSMVEPALLTEAVLRLDGLGFQLHFHAIGDRALTEVLDALAAAHAAQGDRDLRHHVAHLQVVRPDDIGRFRRLGVTANIQPLWAAHEPQMDELCLPFLGPERAAWQYPFADLLASGARLAAGSDWPVSSPDPMQGISVAVNRVVPGAPPDTQVFLPGQRLALADALTAYTSGSARVNHLDDTGIIRAGALADLTVLDRNPFEDRPEDIWRTRAVSTFVEGRRVHPASEL